MGFQMASGQEGLPAGWAIVSESPSVTVLVPSYRHAAFIEQRIESIVAQSQTDFELVVIDDCSDDESDAILKRLSQVHRFRYIRNARNSGSPFAAWAWAAQHVRTTYIWICESDDFAEAEFLQVALEQMTQHPQAAIFYCQSHVVNEHSEVCGHTKDYFANTWRDDRWTQSFQSDGLTEARGFQLRGQTVPNMSSALIRTAAFRSAYSPFLNRLKLTGDWLFVAELMRHGDVIFCNQTLSNFRQHANTARIRVDSSLSQAEFVLIKHRMHRMLGLPVAALGQTLATDAVRFAHDDATGFQVAKRAIVVSPVQCLKLTFDLLVALVATPQLIQSFRGRLALARQLKAKSGTDKI